LRFGRIGAGPGGARSRLAPGHSKAFLRFTKSIGLAGWNMSATGTGKAIKASIKQIAPEMEAALRSKDASKLASMYTSDAVLMPPNQEMVKGRAAIEAWFREPMGRLASVKIAPTRTKVSGDKPFEVGTFETIAEGATAASPMTFKYVLIFKRVRGKWLVDFDIWNSNLPPSNTGG
jgi:uncharacterized protein (TIGR02246 family)